MLPTSEHLSILRQEEPQREPDADGLKGAEEYGSFASEDDDLRNFPQNKEESNEALTASFDSPEGCAAPLPPWSATWPTRLSEARSRLIRMCTVLGPCARPNLEMISSVRFEDVARNP